MGVMWDFFTSNIEIFGLILALLAFFRPDLEKLTHKILNKIDFYPYSKIELGFFDFGPTIGIQFTIRGRGGNQLIRSISLKTTRERDGATYNYNWGIFRNFSASRNGLKFEENLKAEIPNALLLPKDGSNNMNIQFHDNTTAKRFMDDVYHLQTNFNAFLSDQGILDPTPEQILEIQNSFKAIPGNNSLVLDAYAKIGKAFYWEEGKYKILLSIETDKPRRIFKFRYAFSLSKTDVARIEINQFLLIQAAMSSSNFPNFVHPEIQNM